MTVIYYDHEGKEYFREVITNGETHLVKSPQKWSYPEYTDKDYTVGLYYYVKDKSEPQHMYNLYVNEIVDYVFISWHIYHNGAYFGSARPTDRLPIDQGLVEFYPRYEETEATWIDLTSEVLDTSGYNWGEYIYQGYFDFQDGEQPSYGEWGWEEISRAEGWSKDPHAAKPDPIDMEYLITEDTNFYWINPSFETLPVYLSSYDGKDLNNPTRTGYKFLGWSTTKSKNDIINFYDFYMPQDWYATIFYAIWQPLARIGDLVATPYVYTNSEWKIATPKIL